MIETQEEYAKTWALINGQDRQVAKDFHATTEALRDVARAAKPAVMRLQLLQAAGPIGKSPKWTQDLTNALDALPDWITEAE